MILQRKMLPTLRTVRQAHQYCSIRSRAHSRKVLQEQGFKFKGCKPSNRTTLMERPAIINQRVAYLRKIQQYRESGHPIVYADETYVHSHQSVRKCWKESEVCLQLQFSKGVRMVILHAGSEKGFVPGAALVHTSSGDYHDEMNKDNFMRWLSEKLVLNLQPASVLVIDNAAYHNVQEDRCPSVSTRKQEMQAWLTRPGSRRCKHG